MTFVGLCKGISPVFHWAVVASLPDFLTLLHSIGLSEVHHLWVSMNGGEGHTFTHSFIHNTYICYVWVVGKILGKSCVPSSFERRYWCQKRYVHSELLKYQIHDHHFWYLLKLSEWHIKVQNQHSRVHKPSHCTYLGIKQKLKITTEDIFNEQ